MTKTRVKLVRFLGAYSTDELEPVLCKEAARLFIPEEDGLPDRVVLTLSDSPLPASVSVVLSSVLEATGEWDHRLAMPADIISAELLRPLLRPIREVCGTVRRIPLFSGLYELLLEEGKHAVHHIRVDAAEEEPEAPPTDRIVLDARLWASSVYLLEGDGEPLLCSESVQALLERLPEHVRLTLSRTMSPDTPYKLHVRDGVPFVDDASPFHRQADPKSGHVVTTVRLSRVLEDFGDGIVYVGVAPVGTHSISK